MALPKNELIILKDLLELFKNQDTKSEKKFYELNAKKCVDFLAFKYEESETIVWCMFINLVRDGKIALEGNLFRIQKNILSILEEGDDYLYTRLHCLSVKQ